MAIVKIGQDLNLIADKADPTAKGRPLKTQAQSPVKSNEVANPRKSTQRVEKLLKSIDATTTTNHHSQREKTSDNSQNHQ